MSYVLLYTDLYGSLYVICPSHVLSQGQLYSVHRVRSSLVVQ